MLQKHLLLSIFMSKMKVDLDYLQEWRQFSNGTTAHGVKLSTTIKNIFRTIINLC